VMDDVAEHWPKSPSLIDVFLQLCMLAWKAVVRHLALVKEEFWPVLVIKRVSSVRQSFGTTT
jgi:hypothetical protein